MGRKKRGGSIRNILLGLLLLVMVVAFYTYFSEWLETLTDPRTGTIITGIIILLLVVTGLVKWSKVKRALGK